MTAIDDLKPGMFVAVTQYRGETEHHDSWMGFSCNRTPTFDGKPWKVVAISLPFACLTDGRTKISIDLRLWGVQRITRQYAQAFEPGERHVDKPAFGKKRKRKEKPDKRSCPRCGARMVERLKVPGKSVWAAVCRQCGFDGGNTTGRVP